jgi:hypothetical protein
MRTLEQSWRDYHTALAALRQKMLALPLAGNPADAVRAQQWLMQAQAAAYNLVIAPNHDCPQFFKSTVFEPNTYTWLMPNADFVYRYAFLSSTGNYLIRAQRGSSHFLEIQAISGFWGDPALKMLKTYDVEKFTADSNGMINIVVGTVPPTDHSNFIAIDPAAKFNTLLIREAFYDWQSEQGSALSIERLDESAKSTQPTETMLASRIDAAARMIEFCYQTFSGGLTGDVLDAVGTNRFVLVDTSKDKHAANPSAGYVPAVYDLAEDEALIVEITPPSARYWNIHLGDVWWQVTDYTNRQTSLNGHQVAVDADQKVRIVICARDPGVANWLDTTGNQKGVALLRWYFADEYPAPATRRVAIEDLAAELPASTARVAPPDRKQQLRDRRRAVEDRYNNSMPEANK